MAFPAPGNSRFLLPGLLSRRGIVAFALALPGLTPVFAGEGQGLMSITEREIQRRQQAVTEADAKVAEAVKLGDEGKFEEAARLMLKTYESLPNSPIAAPVKDRVRAVYADASRGWAQDLLAQGRKAEALEVLDAVLAENIDPRNEAVLKLKKHANDPDRYPPALSPTHIANAQKVKELLLKAGSYIDLGDYDRANVTYQDVLRIDPYNVAARRGMERAEQHRAEYFEAARVHRRSKQLGEVDALWEEQIPPPSDLGAMFASSAAAGSVTDTARQKLEKKLRNLRVPRAEFNGATLEETVEYLRVQARNLDPQGNGIGFVLNVDEATKQRPITLNLQDVPLEELVRYITQMSGAAFRTEDNAVVITSLTEKSTQLVSKTYRVPPDFIQTAEVGGGAAPAADPFAPQAGGAAQGGILLRRMGAKEFLESRGVTFPAGGGASFSPSSGLLIVRATAEQIDFVDMLVEQAAGAVQKQVKITVRMVEIEQTNFNEDGFDIGIGQANVPGSDRVFASGGTTSTAFKNDGVSGSPGPVSGLPLMSAGLRSSGAIYGVPGITELISQNGETPNVGGSSSSQFALRGVFTDPQIDLVIRQISQKKGSDVVNMPSVVAKSGQKASIRVIREFPYPTEYDPPQIPQSVGGPATSLTNLLTGSSASVVNNSAPVVPATPTAFETKEVGMILDVEPNISADGKSVEIALTPTFVDFEGFIDYGSDISNQIDNFELYGDLTTNLVSVINHGTRYIQQNDILQPVFRKNTTTTSVTVYDGSTIVISGVIEQRTVDIQDKVPVIGDIPLIGRLWQSKVKETRKKNVIFFVSVDVIDPAGQRVNQVSAAR